MAIFIEHRHKRPAIDSTVYIAPNAVISGDVTIGEGSRVLFGAVLTAEGGPIIVGRHCIVMEHAVLRGTPGRPLTLGDHVLVGPRAYLTGCTVEDSVFIATGAAIFNGAWLGSRSEVRVNGVVHLLTKLPADSIVPIGWVAVGDPVSILPPGDHEGIWAIQKPLNFPEVAFGLERPAEGETIMPEVTLRYGRALGKHMDDRILS